MNKLLVKTMQFDIMDEYILINGSNNFNIIIFTKKYTKLRQKSALKIKQFMFFMIGIKAQLVWKALRM